MEHKFDKYGNCGACCCSPTECVKCGKLAHSLGVYDEYYDSETGDCYWMHSYECFECGEEFVE